MAEPQLASLSAIARPREDLLVVVGIDHRRQLLSRPSELADIRVARLLVRPAGREQLVDECADHLADVGREASAVLSDPLVVAARSVDLPMRLLEGADGVGRVKRLRASVAGRREARFLGSRMVAIEGAEPVGVKA